MTISTTLANPVAGVLELLVVQATPFCNLDCAYCYLPHRSSKARMSENTLERLFEAVFSAPAIADPLTILWHAGEPLVPGVAYYERAFAIIDRLNSRGTPIRHSIQTNGTLIDQSWIDFFRTHGVKLGISLDGPQRLHDGCRRTRNGTGTFVEVMETIRLLQANAYPFHVITVLTRESLAAAHDLFWFYVNNRISDVAFNMEEIEGQHSQSSLQFPAVFKSARLFFRELLHLVEMHPGTLNIREFSAAFDMISDPDVVKYGNPQAEPMRIVTVSANGDLSTFSPELLGYRHPEHDTFAFANVYEGGLSQITQSPQFTRAYEQIQRGVERCKRSCDYFDLCLGGAPANKLFENGTFDSAESLYCELSKKALIDETLQHLEAKNSRLHSRSVQ